MDSQNDSTFVTLVGKLMNLQFSRLSKRQTHESVLAPPRQAQEEQSRQKTKVADAEIEELKQSLKYVEIQLARAKEENESLNTKIQEQQQELERGHDNLAKQIRLTNQQSKTIDELQAKIDNFNNSQKDLLEKNRFKAGNYMAEINQREEELGRMRAQVMNMQDELKLLTVSREQFRQQNEILNVQTTDKDKQLDQMSKKIKDQNRLMDSMVVAQRNFGGELDFNEEAMEKARDEIERSERIARNTNKSSFMSLGDKQPKLISEEQRNHQNSGGQGGRWNNQENLHGRTGTVDDTYIFDESIPAEIFPCITKYREKISKSKNPQTHMLALDDFFVEVHKIMRDVQLRELAKVRNEHSVEIMKLRKNLEKQYLKSDPSRAHSHSRVPTLGSRENLQALKTQDKFLENEIEKQRRALLEENELLKKRLRAVETILQSGNQERSKFMEGASWIAKKTHIETEKHIQRIQNIMGEYERKSKEYVIDESIFELNGRDVLKLNKWIAEQFDRAGLELGERFESIFENVNYHLKEATKNFNKYK